MIFGFGKGFSKRTLRVREASMQDAPVITTLHAASFDRPWGLTEIERMLADESILAHVVAGGGQHDPAEGFSLTRIAADEAEILSIAVSPKRRGEGLGRRLIAAQSEMLAVNRVRTLFLEVQEDNASAIALYQRTGFHEVSRRAAYYRKADGSAATAIVMRKVLD
jgi:[ribosomal protein S18]-alanine N-acetyltransferase